MTLVLAAGLAETPQRFSLIIYTFLLPHHVLETKRTQSVRDINTVRVCVCERAQTVSTSKLCKWLQKPSIYTHVTTSSDTWTNRHKLNLCTVMHLGKMSELDQSHESQASDQGKMWRQKKKCHTQSWRVTEVKTQNQRQRGSEEEEEEEQSNKDT